MCILELYVKYLKKTGTDFKISRFKKIIYKYSHVNFKVKLTFIQIE